MSLVASRRSSTIWKASPSASPKRAGPCLRSVGPDAGREAAEAHGGGDQGAGLVGVHALSHSSTLCPVAAMSMAWPATIPAGPAAWASRRTMFRRAASSVIAGGGEVLEGEGEETVPGENRGRFVEGHVHGRMTTAQGVVVHGRRIVVHERIGVDEFHHSACREAGVLGAAEGLARGAGDGRAQALSAEQQCMAHRVAEARSAGMPASSAAPSAASMALRRSVSQASKASAMVQSPSSVSLAW